MKLHKVSTAVFPWSASGLERTAMESQTSLSGVDSQAGPEQRRTHEHVDQLLYLTNELTTDLSAHTKNSRGVLRPPGIQLHSPEARAAKLLGET